MSALIHPFKPVFNADSRILILGSFPSVCSREQNFYYAHPRNRFWKVLAAVFEEDPGKTPEEKRNFLLAHHIALWDVLARCTVEGSSDASIREAEANDLEPLFKETRIRKVLCNGSTAGRFYKKYQQKNIGLEAVVLPSTSPANASWSLDRLTEIWKPAVLEGLQKQPDRTSAFSFSPAGSKEKGARLK